MPLVLLAVLAGCGRLAVQVAVLDPAYVATIAEQATLRQQLTTAIGQSAEDVAEEFAPLLEAHTAFYATLASDYRREADDFAGAARSTLLELADSFLPDFERFVVPEYERSMTSIVNLNARIREEYLESEQSGDLIEGRLAMLLRQRLAETRRVQQFRSEDVAEKSEEFVDGTGEQTSNGLRVRKQVVDSQGALGSNIQSSPLAYAVANAPKDKWGDNLLNDAYGRGRLGNMNVAIRLGSDADVFGGDFTIKGLTFDPSEVAAVASKAATQAVLLAAQISGVPVATSGTQSATGAGAALAAGSTRLAVLQTEAAETTAFVADHERALLLLADVVLGESGRWLNADPEVRAASIRAIASTYESHKRRLDLSQIN